MSAEIWEHLDRAVPKIIKEKSRPERYNSSLSTYCDTLALFLLCLDRLEISSEAPPVAAGKENVDIIPNNNTFL